MSKDDLNKISNVTMGGINLKDWPDLCDSFVESCFIGERQATESELEDINNNHGEIVYELAVASIF